MFDIGWTELLLIGLVALIVVGPKDLPGMFRTLGQFTAKAKRMAREFTSAMEAAADEAGVKEVGQTLRDASNPKKMGLDAIKKAADFDVKPGSETAKLSQERAAERAEIKAKMSQKTADATQAVEASEAADAEAVSEQIASAKAAEAAKTQNTES